jgi:hypothetical protein
VRWLKLCREARVHTDFHVVFFGISQSFLNLFIDRLTAINAFPFVGHDLLRARSGSVGFNTVRIDVDFLFLGACLRFGIHRRGFQIPNALFERLDSIQ